MPGTELCVEHARHVTALRAATTRILSRPLRKKLILVLPWTYENRKSFNLKLCHCNLQHYKQPIFILLLILGTPSFNKHDRNGSVCFPWFPILSAANFY